MLRKIEKNITKQYGIIVPSRDIKAVTQEDRTVRQDVVQIFSHEGRCIGALIREKDISAVLLQEKKYRTLARNYEKEDISLRASDISHREDIAMREIHHRVKNNLQLVASFLNLQARRCKDSYTKKSSRRMWEGYCQSGQFMIY